jgi:hypothetical protein
VTVGLLRRSISEGSNNRKSQAVFENTRVSEATLCPPGQSKKAIGQEPPIGPCIATLEWTMIRLVISETDGRRHGSEMDTTGARKQSLRPISWAECREKKIGIEPKESTFFLTFLPAQTVDATVSITSSQIRCHEEPISLVIFGQNLARVAFRLI